MANRDDHRGYGGDGGRDRWRQDGRNWDDRRRSDWQGGREERSFGDEGRFNSDQARYGRGSRGGEGEAWRRDRYGSRFDQDRTGYGSGYDQGRHDYGAGAVGRGYGGYGGYPNHGAEGRGYGGQEYGVESGRGQSGEGLQGRSQGRGEFETWRPHGAAPYGDLEFNARASGVEEFGAPHDYAYHPQHGHEFEPDYLHWREEQLRAHDRDYREWRKHQQEQLDEEYRRFRTERRDTFGKNFHEWRSQRNAAGGMREQHIGPETGDWSRRQAQGFGQGGDRPSGSLEGPGAMTPSPSLQQGAGGGSGEGSQQTTQGAGGSEFGKAPEQVQAATDGSSGRRDDEARQSGEGGADEGRQPH